MEAREIKALQIAATMPLKRTTYGWQVPSQSGPTIYKVASTNPKMARMDTVSGLACNCPDYELRGLPCKHIMAVEFTIKREITPDGEVVTEQVKVTYSQDWPAYNRAQCEEKDRFLPMLADLCSTIPEAPAGSRSPTAADERYGLRRRDQDLCGPVGAAVR